MFQREPPKHIRRMLDIEQASSYMGIGKTLARQKLKEIKAERHIGRRVVYDKEIIDKYLDNLK